MDVDVEGAEGSAAAADDDGDDDEADGCDARGLGRDAMGGGTGTTAARLEDKSAGAGGPLVDANEGDTVGAVVTA